MQNKSDIEQAPPQSPHDEQVAKIKKEHKKFRDLKKNVYKGIKKIEYPKDPAEPLPV